jgi:mRNA-degrading endonuclease RelE of RelBE toxin-antitoxin system
VTYQVEVTPEFERDLARLDQQARGRILAKVEWLAEHPEAIPIPMKHLPRDLVGLRKYRVGDYRVFFWLTPSRRLLTLYGVEHRRSAYRNL